MKRKFENLIRRTFKPLGLHPYIQDDSTIYIYEPSNRGLDYVGTIKPIIEGSNVSYEYSSITYKDIDMLISAIRAHNATLIFPAYTDNPMTYEALRFESKISWYMRDILEFDRPRLLEKGQFQFSWTNAKAYIKRNHFGEIISNICVRLNDPWNGTTPLDEATGHVIRYLSTGYSWVQTDFKGVDACIAAINGMVEPEFLADIATRIGTLDKLSPERNYDSSMCKLSGLNVLKENNKNATRKMLLDALAKLDA